MNNIHDLYKKLIEFTKAVADLVFINAAATNGVALAVIPLNTFPQMLNLALDYNKLDEKSSCKRHYTTASDALSMVASTASGILAGADLENTLSKIIEGLDTALDVISDAKEISETCSEKDKSTAYKVFNSVYTMIDMLCCLGYAGTLASEDFAGTKVNIAGVEVDMRDIFPTIKAANIGLSLLMQLATNSCYTSACKKATETCCATPNMNKKVMLATGSPSPFTKNSHFSGKNPKPEATRLSSVVANYGATSSYQVGLFVDDNQKLTHSGCFSSSFV